MAKNNKVRQRRPKENAKKGKPLKEQNHDRDDNSGSCVANFLTACFIIVGLITAALAYAYATSPIKSVVVDTHDAAGMKWNREFNTNLRKGQQLFPDLVGAESIAVDEQENWYTGLNDGRLIKISDAGKPTENVRDITSEVDYTANGGKAQKRPLGMRIFQQKLYFADSYQGIFSMDLKTLSWEKIVGFNDVSPPLNYANDLTISKDGMIYFIDACGDWNYEDTVYGVIEGGCTGRLLRIGKDGKGLQLLRDNICFPNGIELTRDEKRLLISEFGRRRILVIDVNTHATVKSVLLHGGGDNIRRSPSGGYWVPMPAIAHPAEQFVNRYPFIRDVAMKFIGANHLDKIVDIRQGTIVKLDEELEIEQIHQDLQGKVAWGISHVQEYQPGRLLMGSFTAPGIIKLDMPPP